MGVLVKTVNTLRSEAFKKLTSTRETKKAAVERYLHTIHNQIITFSEEKTVIEAMQELGGQARNVQSDNQIGPSQLKRMRQKLHTYYQKDFANAFRKQNNQTLPPLDRYLNRLDSDAVALQYYYIQTNPNPLGSKHKLDRARD